MKCYSSSSSSSFRFGGLENQVYSFNTVLQRKPLQDKRRRDDGNNTFVLLQDADLGFVHIFNCSFLDEEQDAADENTPPRQQQVRKWENRPNIPLHTLPTIWTMQSNTVAATTPAPKRNLPSLLFLAASTADEDTPFFGPSNTDNNKLAISRFPMLVQDVMDIYHRFLAQSINQAYGMVPILNSFTTAKRKQSPNLEIAEEAPVDLAQDFWQARGKKRSQKNVDPCSPALPTARELETHSLVCYQIGFSTGRQALFQALEVSKSGENLSELVGEYVAVSQDDGVDIGVLRAYAYIGELRAQLPELAFMPVLRLATAAEVGRFPAKAREEAHALRLAREIVRRNPSFANSLCVEHCEFQYDRNKLIVYCDIPRWMEYKLFVSQLFARVERELHYQPRIFVHRKHFTRPMCCANNI